MLKAAREYKRAEQANPSYGPVYYNLGLLYLDTEHPDMHGLAGTIETPLTKLPYDKLCPGSAALDALMNDFR